MRREKHKKRYVACPENGISWGLAFEFMFRHETVDEWVVYRCSNGEVVARYSIARLGKYFAEHYASQRSFKLNGGPGVDLAGIDATP